MIVLLPKHVHLQKDVGAVLGISKDPIEDKRTLTGSRCWGAEEEDEGEDKW